jgi:hypothetical protein
MAIKDTTASQAGKQAMPPFVNWAQSDAAMAVQKAFLESYE